MEEIMLTKDEAIQEILAILKSALYKDLPNEAEENHIIKRSYEICLSTLKHIDLAQKTAGVGLVSPKR